MTTALAVRDKTELSPFAAFAAEGEAQAIAGELLTFSKGVWYAGQDKNVVKEGKSFVANLGEFYTGWIKWQDSMPVDIRLERVADRTPTSRPIFREDLGDNDPALWDRDRDGKPRDPWQQTNRLVMRAYKADTQELYTFTTSSWGGRRAVQKLCGEYDQLRQKHAGMLPVVTIGVATRRHKDYGMIADPALEVIGCTTWELGGKSIRLKKDEPVSPKQIAKELDDEIPF
jgi:hypothetical protein